MDHSFNQYETIELDDDDDEAVSSSSISFISNGGEPLIRLLQNRTSNLNHTQDHKTRFHASASHVHVEHKYLRDIKLSSDNAFSSRSSNGVACQLTF